MPPTDTLRSRARPELAWRDTLEINVVGLATIPMLAFIGPRVVQNDADACRIRIPFNWRTGNHMGSMYFGVLCAGADVASGMPVLRLMREHRRFVVPSFKDLHAEFLRRAEADVTFENLDLAGISEAYEETLRTGERVNVTVRIAATVPEAAEPVARFATTLSMRYRPDAKPPLVQRLLTLF